MVVPSVLVVGLSVPQLLLGLTVPLLMLVALPLVLREARPRMEWMFPLRGRWLPPLLDVLTALLFLLALSILAFGY